jgi:hypothetical protein
MQKDKQVECKACTPKFDAVKARKMSWEEVRKVYPRFSGYCEKCGYYGAKYASFEHYIAGDY